MKYLGTLNRGQGAVEKVAHFDRPMPMWFAGIAAFWYGYVLSWWLISGLVHLGQPAFGAIDPSPGWQFYRSAALVWSAYVMTAVICVRKGWRFPAIFLAVGLLAKAAFSWFDYWQTMVARDLSYAMVNRVAAFLEMGVDARGSAILGFVELILVGGTIGLVCTSKGVGRDQPLPRVDRLTGGVVLLACVWHGYIVNWFVSSQRVTSALWQLFSDMVR